MATVSIVIPVYNEEAALEPFHTELAKTIGSLPFSFDFYYVDDGSTDETAGILRRLSEADSRVHAIRLSRNFGHQAALTAGLDHASGDILITLDADGQHPPGLIPQMLDLYQSGCDIVLTQRIDEGEQSIFKRGSSAVFYWLLNRLGDTHILPGAADFRLMSREVVDSLKGMREYHRFLRGMVAWLGYRTVIIPYVPSPRIAGSSKYSLRKMVRLAMDAVFSFSLAPLQIGLTLGLFFFVLAIVEVIYVLSFWVRGRADLLAPGWSSLMFMILIVGGVLTTVLGFIGVYVGYIFQEVKGRPVYVARKSEKTESQESSQERKP